MKTSVSFFFALYDQASFFILIKTGQLKIGKQLPVIPNLSESVATLISNGLLDSREPSVLVAFPPQGGNVVCFVVKMLLM